MLHQFPLSSVIVADYIGVHCKCSLFYCVLLWKGVDQVSGKERGYFVELFYDKEMPIFRHA